MICCLVGFKNNYRIFLTDYLNSFMTEAVANQWTGFYMITASAMKELTFFISIDKSNNSLCLFTIINRLTFYRITKQPCSQSVCLSNCILLLINCMFPRHTHKPWGFRLLDIFACLINC